MTPPTIILCCRYFDLFPTKCQYDKCKATNVQACGGCHVFHYCCRDHQRRDWNEGHKLKCRMLGAAEGTDRYPFELATSFTFSASQRSSEELLQDQQHPIFIANLQLRKQEALAIRKIKAIYETPATISTDQAYSLDLSAELATRITTDGQKGLAYGSILSLIYLSALADKASLWKAHRNAHMNSNRTPTVISLVYYNSMSMPPGNEPGGPLPASPTRVELEQAYHQASIPIDAVSKATPSFWPQLCEKAKAFNSDRSFHNIPIIGQPLNGSDALSWTFHVWVMTLCITDTLHYFQRSSSLDELLACPII